VNRSDLFDPQFTASEEFTFVKYCQTSPGRYSFTLCFINGCDDGTDFFCTLSCKSYSNSVQKIADFLETHHIHNFDLYKRGKSLGPHGRIVCDDLISVLGGFDDYLCSSWNKIMHSINGNMESTSRDEEREHLPRDKRHEKQNTRNQDRKHQLNKKFAGKVDKRVYVKKEVSSKLIDESDQKSQNIRADQIDISVPVVAVEPVAPAPVIPVNTDAFSHFGFTQGRLDFEYTIKDQAIPTAFLSNYLQYTHYFGCIPKFTLRPLNKSDFMFYTYHIIFSIIFLLGLYGYIDDYVLSVTHKYLVPKVNDVNCMRSEGSPTYFFYKLMVPYMMHLVHYFIVTFISFPLYQVTGVFTVNFVTFLFSKTLFGMIIYTSFTYVFSYYRWLLVWPVKLRGLHPYYRRSIQFLNVDGPLPQNTDFRREAEKNFKISLDQKIYTYSDRVTYYIELGYEIDGAFHRVNIEEIETTSTLTKCDMELVTQILCPKNMNMNISPESMLERMGNSTNLGPFISSSRTSTFVDDIPNNSARIAYFIALTHRHNYPQDIFDQLFRQADRIRPFRPRRI
jgi:hypothetical protein